MLTITNFVNPEQYTAAPIFVATLPAKPRHYFIKHQYLPKNADIKQPFPEFTL